MNHETYKKGNPNYFIGKLLWANFRDNNTLIPRPMQAYFGDSWHPRYTVHFYEYPDGFYGGQEGRVLWKLNNTHREWVMTALHAIEGHCECA